MTDSMNQLMTRLFVEQPLALPGSANNMVINNSVSAFFVVASNRSTQ